MTGHSIYPAYDDKYPTTLSEKIIKGLLREELGFDGVIVTDAIGMAAILKQWPLPQACAMAIKEQRGISMPVIFITGHGNIPMSVKGMKAGAVDFLPKPFTKLKLLDAITQAIAKNKVQIKEQAAISKFYILFPYDRPYIYAP